MSQPTVLVADPEESARERTAAAVAAAEPPVEVRTAASGAAVRTALESGPIDVIVTAAALGDETATELTARVRSVDPDTAVIVYADADELDADAPADPADDETVVQYLPREAPDAEALLGSLIASATDRHQAAYPIPDDESARLAALDRHDPRGNAAVVSALERVAALAAARFETDGIDAAVTLVGEHAVETVTGRSPTTAREDAPAALTVVHGLVTVEDTDIDDRFADNEVLRAAGIRSYLGAAIEVDGRSIGAVEVYADAARQFTPADERFVEQLAGLAGAVVRLGGDSR